MNPCSQTLATLVAQYHVYQDAMRTLSPNTRRNYYNRLAHLLRWLPEGATVADFTLPILRRYFVSLSDAGKTAPPMYKYSIAHFGDWLVDEEILEINPARSIRLAKPDPPERRIIKVETMRGFLDACDRLKRVSPHKKLLIKALFYTFAYSGLRRAELRALRVRDVDFDQKTLSVHRGKGNKNRGVAIPTDLCALLRQWLDTRPNATGDDWLFVRVYNDARAHNGQIAFDTLYTYRDRIVEEMEAAGTHLFLHDLRRGYATRLAKEGTPLPVIRDQLGHANIATTDKYLMLSDEASMAQAAERAVLPPVLPTQPPASTPKAQTPRDMRHRVASNGKSRRTDLRR